MAKREYYSCRRALETGAQWLFLIGGRNIGKSYDVKKTVVEDCFKRGVQFVYLRRWNKDIKQNGVESYFFDCPVKDITKGKFDGIMAYQGYLYFYIMDSETNKPIRSIVVGRYCALNESARYKSQVFENTEYIIYEEMIPDDNMYLDNETTRLQNFVSTVLRSKSGRIFLIGNTLSRVCPYVKDYSLSNFLRMKQGDIDIYNYHTPEGDVKLCVEYCAIVKQENKMFFGQASKQIVSGEWEVEQANKLPYKIDEYEKVYEMLIEFQDFKFMLWLLVSKKTGGRICYVYPYTNDIDSFRGFRVLTDRFSDNPFISARLDLSKRPEQYIAECFALNKICFSDNLTGSDFRAVNEHFKIATMF